MKMVSYEKMTSEQGWFSVIPILSYNKFVNILIGARSLGKSVAVALWVLYRFLKAGEQFIYTRRTDDTLKLTMDDWFFSACRILQINGVDFDFKMEGNKYYINGAVAGYAVALSMQHKYKGKDFENVFWICFDEFIAAEGERYVNQNSRFLTEYENLIQLAQTADRTVGNPRREEVKIFCMGNANSLFNPVIMGVGADKFIRPESHFIAPKKSDWAMQLLVEDDSAAAGGYEDYVYYRLATPDLKSSAYGNRMKEFAETPFVKKIKTPMTPLCNFIWDSHHFGFYGDYDKGIFYISNKVNCSEKTLALSFDDHKPNYMLAKLNNVYISLLKDAYVFGNLFFETNALKNYIDGYLKYTR